MKKVEEEEEDVGEGGEWEKKEREERRTRKKRHVVGNWKLLYFNLTLPKMGQVLGSFWDFFQQFATHKGNE